MNFFSKVSPNFWWLNTYQAVLHHIKKSPNICSLNKHQVLARKFRIYVLTSTPNAYWFPPTLVPALCGICILMQACNCIYTTTLSVNRRQLQYLFLLNAKITEKSKCVYFSFDYEITLLMDHWLWTVQSLEKFQNAIFYKISKIPFMGYLKWV